MRWKSVAGWARLSIVGVSLISIGYGTDMMRPAHVFIQNGWSSAGVSADVLLPPVKEAARSKAKRKAA